MRRIFLFLACMAGCVWAGEDPRIAFSALRDGRWQLFTCDRDGKNARKIMEGPWDVRDPAWFPDRRRLAVTTTSGRAYVVEEKTGRIADSVPPQEFYLWNAAPSADGKQLFLVAGRSAEIDQTFMAIYDLGSRRLTQGLRLPTPMYQLRADPKGGKLAFANMICGSACGKVIQEIWVHDPVLGMARQVSLLNGLSRHPNWLPDGSGLIFDSNPAGASAIYLQALARAEPEKLLGDPRDISQYAQPAVSPDGRRLVFIKDGLLHICSLDRPGDAAALKPFPDEPRTRVRDPAW